MWKKKKALKKIIGYCITDLRQVKVSSKDIDNISEAYYKDILKAINRLKRCNWTGKRNLTSSNKTFEMRQNDIRVTVKIKP